MKMHLFALAFTLMSIPVSAEPPSPSEQSLYEKSRVDVLLNLSDEDLTAYCVTLKFGSDLLPELRKQVLAAESEVSALKEQGLQETHPRYRSAAAVLKSRREQFNAELAALRKGLKIEQAITQTVMAELNKRSKFF